MTIFHSSAFALTFLIILAGCSASDDTLSCDLQRDSKGNVETSNEKLMQGAISVQNEAAILRGRLERLKWVGGLYGEILSYIPNTDAVRFRSDLMHLQSDVARQKALEMAATNAGDTLIGTTRDWQCRLFSNSVAVLDPGLSRSAIDANLKEIESHFSKLAAIYRDSNGVLQ